MLRGVNEPQLYRLRCSAEPNGPEISKYHVSLKSGPESPEIMIKAVEAHSTQPPGIMLSPGDMRYNGKKLENYFLAHKGLLKR